jgi:MerR family transcriptional regulator, repressor of the yfmOP operon
LATRDFVVAGGIMASSMNALAHSSPTRHADDTAAAGSGEGSNAASEGGGPQEGAGPDERLLGIGAAAARAGVSERALRYYQQIGLITPSGCTPGGMRRYSQADLDRVTRIRELQSLLGLDLDEIAEVLANEDRLNDMRAAYWDSHTKPRQRRSILKQSLSIQEELRGTVQAKRDALDLFLADLDTRIARIQDLLEPADRRKA